MTFNWSKGPFITGTVYAAVVSIVGYIFDVQMALPWQPISTIGIAVAFYLGFKNNSSYDRTWEARKIWGGIVNSSRTFGSSIIAFIQLIDKTENAAVHQSLIYRHIAWLTALRYQLRLSREWEHMEDRLNRIYIPAISEEYYNRLDHEIASLLEEEEVANYRSKANIAAQILARQTLEIQSLYTYGILDGFQFQQLQNIIATLYDEQGRCERIKNFPFPRQYASTTLWTTVVFCALVPFGMNHIFEEMVYQASWISILFSGLIIWIYFLMEKIGDYSENPFEGTYNDVPISSIARTIEIDLREMLQEENIPQPLVAENGFLM